MALSSTGCPLISQFMNSVVISGIASTGNNGASWMSDPGIDPGQLSVRFPARKTSLKPAATASWFPDSQPRPRNKSPDPIAVEYKYCPSPTGTMSRQIPRFHLQYPVILRHPRQIHASAPAPIATESRCSPPKACDSLPAAAETPRVSSAHTGPDAAAHQSNPACSRPTPGSAAPKSTQSIAHWCRNDETRPPAMGPPHTSTRSPPDPVSSAALPNASPNSPYNSIRRGLFHCAKSLRRRRSTRTSPSTPPTARALSNHMPVSTRRWIPSRTIPESAPPWVSAERTPSRPGSDRDSKNTPKSRARSGVTHMPIPTTSAEGMAGSCRPNRSSTSPLVTSTGCDVAFNIR